MNMGTDRISLRQLAANDMDLYCELYTDAAAMRFIGAPLSHDRALRSFAKALRLTRCDPARSAQQLLLAVVEKATQQAIGICSIQPFGACRRCAEAGIILRPAMHARGIGKEAFAALISQGFAMLDVDEIRAHIAVDNSAAAGVLTGLGFRCCDDSVTTQRLRTSAWSVDRESWRRKPRVNRNHSTSQETRQ